MQWHANNWQGVKDHPYVCKKGITYTEHLRVLPDSSVAFPLFTLDEDREIVGIQKIYPNGRKLIYGKKKGAFAVIGDLASAAKLFFCEGYATGSAIMNLIHLTERYPTLCAVVVCLDAHNVVTVSRLLTERYRDKKPIICPDNDWQKHAEQREKPIANAGMKAGLLAAINCHAPIKRLAPLRHISDWCDYYQINTEEAVAAFKQVMEPVTLKKYYLEYVTYFEKAGKTLELCKAVVATMKVAIMAWPHQLDETEFLAQLSTCCSHTGIKKLQIKQWWMHQKRRRFGLALRASSIKREQGRQVTIYDVDSFDQIKTIMDAITPVVDKAIFITNAPMGEGKTKHWLKPAFKAADAANHLPVMITPVRSLTQRVAHDFNASHYIEDDMLQINKGQQTIPSSLAITINSIINKKYQAMFSFSQALFIDEYTQVLRSITQGTVENHLRNRTENRLVELINQAAFCYLADADFNQIAIDHLSESVDDDRPIIIFKHQKKSNPGKQNSDKNAETIDVNRGNQATKPIRYVIHRQKDANFAPKLLIQTIIEQVSRGKRVAVIADSKAKLAFISHALSQLPNKDNSLSILTITSETAGQGDVQQFITSPDSYLQLKKPDIVLISPAIQSGLSIESDYFDRCFGLYAGTVTPVIFQQMLHRIRQQRVFHLTLPGYTRRKQPASENPDTLLWESYQQAIEQFGASQAVYDAKTGLSRIGQLAIKQENGKLVISGDENYCRYEQLSAQMQALDNQQSNHCSSFFCLQAMARGIQIRCVSARTSQKDRQRLKDEFSIIKADIAARETSETTGNVTLTPEQARYLHQKTAMTAEEQRALRRFTIKEQLHLNRASVFTLDVEFYNNKGHYHVANYQALLAGLDSAKQNDLADRKKGVAKTNASWRASKVKLLTQVFDQLGIDREQGTGWYGQSQAQAVREIIANSDELSRYVTFTLGIDITGRYSSIALVNKILKKLLGLSIVNQQIRDNDQRYRLYTIDNASFNVLRYYYAMKMALPTEQINQLKPLMKEDEEELQRLLEVAVSQQMGNIG